MVNTASLVVNVVIAIIGIIILAIFVVNLLGFWRTYNGTCQALSGNWPAFLFALNLLGAILGLILIILGAVGIFLAARPSKHCVPTIPYGQQPQFNQFGYPMTPVTGANPQVVTEPPLGFTQVPVNQAAQTFYPGVAPPIAVDSV